MRLLLDKITGTVTTNLSATNAISLLNTLISSPYLVPGSDGAVYGFSVDLKLFATATRAFRVRRSSDNTESDIGFSGNLVDTAALLAFCGAGDGFIVTLYCHFCSTTFTVSTANLQPQIVASGVLVTSKTGQAISRFDNSNDSFSGSLTVATDYKLVAGSWFNASSYIGKTNSSGDGFDLMDYPGDMSASIANWINCLHPDTKVTQATPESFTRREYIGKLVSIVTDTGNKISVTVNHPILTDAGWVAADQLIESDCVISSDFFNAYGFHFDVKDRIPTIEKVYNFFSIISAPVRCAGSIGDIPIKSSLGLNDIPWMMFDSPSAVT